MFIYLAKRETAATNREIGEMAGGIRFSAVTHQYVRRLSAAFHKYAFESVRPEEARGAVSKGERDSVCPRNTSPYL